MTVNATRPRDAASDRGEDRSRSDAENGDPMRMSGKDKHLGEASARFDALPSSLDRVPLEMLRDLSLNPVDDPDDIPSVIALCDEEDDAEDLATVADLERDVEVVSRWIADEEAKAEERRRRLEAIRDDISSETHTETRTAGDGARDAVVIAARAGDGSGEVTEEETRGGA
jgi:hypothetical protein